MILCKHCNTIWDAGSEYCGSCGGSLGKRVCPKGHEVDLDAKFCTKCGSRKLSRGVEVVEYRPIVVIALILMTSCAILIFRDPLADLGRTVGMLVLRVFAYFLGITFIAGFGGKEACRAWLDLCGALLRLCWAIISWPFRNRA